MNVSYDLNRIGPHKFENLCQSLAMCILGDGVTVFGGGPDGGRDATFEGTFYWPPTKSHVEGYLVIQAKHKRKPTGTRGDSNWFQTQVRQELEKWRFAAARHRHPDYMIFATNVPLSAVSGQGGIDRLQVTANKYIQAPGASLKAVWIWHYDQICSYLDKYESVRSRYAEFTTSSEVLAELLKGLERERPDLRQRIRESAAKDVRPLRVDTGNSKSRKIPVGDQLVDYIVRHKSPFEKRFEIGGRGPLAWFCHALAETVIEEMERAAGPADEPHCFFKRYGIYVLSKVIELNLTEAKLNPFERFDAESLSGPLNHATLFVHMFQLQECLWGEEPDAKLYAHVSGNGIVGWSKSGQSQAKSSRK
jgi:hypothetical protein